MNQHLCTILYLGVEHELHQVNEYIQSTFVTLNGHIEILLTH